MKYLLVNVYNENLGYSFMLYGKTRVKTHDGIIKYCRERHLFKNDEDAENCEIVECNRKDVDEFAYFGGEIFDMA